MLSHLNLVTPSLSQPDMLEVPRKSLHEEVAERLRQLITEGQLLPGERLNERVLCERLNVSRTPMREAMKVLATEKLIELSPNKGASVIQLTPKDIQQLFEVMAALEGLSGEVAARNHAQSDADEIRALHFEMMGAHARRDLPNYYRLNRAVHEAINCSAGNQVLTETYQSVNTRIQHLRFKSNFNTDKWNAAMKEHEHILQAFLRRDGQLLKALLEAHLRNKRDAVLETLQAN